MARDWSCWIWLMMDSWLSSSAHFSSELTRVVVTILARFAAIASVEYSCEPLVPPSATTSASASAEKNMNSVSVKSCGVEGDSVAMVEVSRTLLSTSVETFLGSEILLVSSAIRYSFLVFVE